MPRHRVMVDDNYQDPDERSEHGNYATVEEALAACREIVDRSLAEEHRPGISAEALYDRYMSFGDDPSIVVLDGCDDSARFSAWSYAKEPGALGRPSARLSNHRRPRHDSIPSGTLSPSLLWRYRSRPREMGFAFPSPCRRRTRQ